jgi:hypothetical protein
MLDGAALLRNGGRGAAHVRRKTKMEGVMEKKTASSALPSPAADLWGLDDRSRTGACVELRRFPRGAGVRRKTTEASAGCIATTAMWVLQL